MKQHLLYMVISKETAFYMELSEENIYMEISKAHHLSLASCL